MKKFSFPLDRALSLRGLQREQQRTVLQQRVSERDSILHRQSSLHAEKNAFEQSLAQALHFDGYQVATLAGWQNGIRKNLATLATTLQQAEQRIAVEQVKLREAERAVKLLERLRERRLAVWKTDVSREEETFAAEAYLAQCIRLKKINSSGA